MEADDPLPLPPEGGEQIVIQGFRMSRNRTNYLYRGTAMTTTDAMDIDELRLEALFFETALGHIAAAFATIALIAKARSDHNLCIQRAKVTLRYLTVAVGWMTSHIEGLYLDIEDRLYYVRTLRVLPSTRLRRINDLTDDNVSYELFGFKIEELQLLYRHWRIPTTMREARNVFSGEEAMLVFLYHIRTATPNTQMARDTFGGDARLFTHYIRAITDHLYTTFYHKISGDSMRQWVHLIDDFRGAIWAKLQDGIVNERSSNGGEINWEILLPEDSFRIFGWLDDTDMRTNRPRSARVTNSDQNELRDTQQAFYNRYFRSHGLKAQVLLLPNGMIGSIFICSLRHNDNGVQNLSGLNDYLLSLVSPLYYNQDNPIYPAVYGDGIFATLATIMKPYPNPNHEQRIVNTRFSSLREDIEHKFAQVFGLYKILNMQSSHYLFWNGEHVRKLFHTCLFVSNCYTCFNESRNRAFEMRAPTLQQYLPVDEVLQPAPVPQLNEGRPSLG